MDEKDDKKKESIDDILSDLNGLLNRMPSILDGIKMPPLGPVEFENPANGPKAETRAIATPGEEGQAREAIYPAQEQNIHVQDGTAGDSDLPSLSGAVEGEEFHKPAAQDPVADPFFPPAEKKSEKLVAQSLGDYMFGGQEKPKSDLSTRSANLDSEGKSPSLPAPIALDAQAGQKTAEDEISGLEPLTAAPLFGYAGDDDIKEELSALSGTPGDAEAGVPHIETGFGELSSEDLLPPAENEKVFPASDSGDNSLLSGTPELEAGREAEPAHAKPRSYESTMDLGIPDIDTLFKMSQGEMPDTPAPSAAETLSALGGREPVASSGAETPASEPLALSKDEPVVSAPLTPASSGAENLEQELEKITIMEVAPMTLNENNPAENGKEEQDLQGETVKLDPAAPEAAGGLVLEQPGAVLSKENSPEGDNTLTAAPAPESAEQPPAADGEPPAAPVTSIRLFISPVRISPQGA